MLGEVCGILMEKRCWVAMNITQHHGFRASVGESRFLIFRRRR